MGCGESKKIVPEDSEDITAQVYFNTNESLSSSEESASSQKIGKNRLFIRGLKTSQSYLVELSKQKPEIDIVTKATWRQHHSQYVDLCQWNPGKNDLFVTASDKRALLWNCQDFKDANSVNVAPISTADHIISALDWSGNGKTLVLGT